MVLQPRLVQIEVQAQNILTLEQVNGFLLELSYMPRTPHTIGLVDQLLDRKLSLEAVQLAVAS